jgi:hypothetical protein
MNVSEEIIKFAGLFEQILILSEDKLPLPKELEEESNKLLESIISSMVENPGQLIYYDDPNKIKMAKMIIDFLWDDLLDPQSIFDEFHGGKYTHVLIDIMGDYSDRIKIMNSTVKCTTS